MAREQYVRPPLVPREAPAAWRAVWPFRLAALLVLALLAGLLVWAYSALNDAPDQDPDLQASAVLRALRVVALVVVEGHG